MIRRTVWVVLGVVIGGAVAVADQASVGHLRAYLPGLVPVWAQDVDADTTLTGGVATDQYLGGMPVTMAWRVVGLGARGPKYAMRFVGDGGLAAASRATLSGAGFQLSDFGGQIDIELLLPGLAAQGIKGRVAADKSSGLFVPGQGMRDVSGSGRFTGMVIWGHEFGWGDLVFQSDDATWTLDIAGDGAAISYQLRVVGRYGETAAEANVVVTRTDDLPPELAQRFDRVMTATATGWQYDGPLDFGPWIAQPGR